MRARGYSLVELAMAIAIAGIVTLAALSSFTVVNRQLVQMRTETMVEEKLQRVLASLGSDAQEVGGGPIRPWHAALMVPGDAASQFSDSLMLLTADSNAMECAIESYDEPTDTLRVPVGADSSCCLAPGAAFTAPTGHFAIFTLNDDSLTVCIAQVNPDCSARAPVIFQPQRSTAFPDGIPVGEPATGFAGGIVTIVDAKYLAVDHNVHALNAYMLACMEQGGVGGSGPPGIGGIDSQTRTLAEDVYDFQVAVGYDLNLDGTIRESAGGVADEWLGNAAGELAGEQWVGDEQSESGSTGFVAQRLRMIEFGLIIGLKSKIDKNRAGVQVLDGPVRPSTQLYLRSGRARAMFRNSGIFQ